ncbi:hypothetical protein BGZ73_000516 [Actinomortierella ambigua]|nr:hypothetical protein BGZ73_000516 [Actinomortierella ambigua]
MTVLKAWAMEQGFKLRLGRSRPERGETEDLALCTQAPTLSSEHKAKVADCVRLKYGFKDTMNALRDAWPEEAFQSRRVETALREARATVRAEILSRSGFIERADMPKPLEAKT